VDLLLKCRGHADEAELVQAIEGLLEQHDQSSPAAAA
jgi:hypothetical protein